jgi:hypothetical protein
MNTSTNLEEFLHRAAFRILSLSDRVDDWLDMSFKKLRQLIEVKGNGVLTERTIEVSSFLRLHLTVPGAIELIPSDEEKVVIKTDENLISTIEAVNFGRTLYISAQGRLQAPDFTSILIQIYIRQLDNLYVSHSGGDFDMISLYENRTPLDVKVQSDGNVSLQLEAPSIKILSQTNGNVRLSGSCYNLHVKAQNNGNFDARQMKASVVEFVNQSNGNAWIYGSEELTIKHQANGFLYYYGDGRLKEFKQYGNGPVQHKKEGQE